MYSGDPCPFCAAAKALLKTKNVEIEYDYTNNIAIVNDIKHDTIKKVNIKENVQDIISTFYFLRNHFDVSKLQVNDFIRITMFFDADNYNFKIYVNNNLKYECKLIKN